MWIFDKLLQIVARAVAGSCIGVVLGVVVVGLVGGLAAIPQVDWRHSDALTDVAGNALMIGLIFGTLLGAPVGAAIGLVTGVILGLRSPPPPWATAGSPSTGPSGTAGKPARPFDHDFGTVGESTEKAPARPRRTWLAFFSGLGVLILALWLLLNLFWKDQLRAERQETDLRLHQIASGDGGEDVRSQALEAIRGLGPYAAPPVVEALGSQDRNLRRAALLASGEVLGTCLAKLGEMNCSTGFVPSRGAAESGFEQLTAALIHALGDGDRAFRLDAVRVLSRIQDHQWTGLGASKNLVGGVLKEALETEGDPAARRDLIRLLGMFQPSLHRAGTSALVEAMEDPDEGVRQAALQVLRESLARWGSSHERDVLAMLRGVAPRLLPEAKKEKDVAALKELGTLGEPGAARALIELLHDPGARGYAAAALGRLGYLTFRAEFGDTDRIREELRDSIPSLIAALGDAGQDVRRHAANALGSMGAEALPAIPALEKAAETEKNQNIRHWMVEACRSINRAAEIGRLRGKAAPPEGGRRRP
jgi:HEAT repeat protein